MVHNMDIAKAATDRRERPSWLAVTTGLNAAIAVSYLVCKPPETHTLSLKARLFTSALYILITCLAGTSGTWIALSRESRKQFRGLVLWGARGWVFLPTIMMFLRERSVWAPLIAVSSAALMAVYPSRMTGAMTHRSSEDAKPRQDIETDIFITQLRFEPISWITISASLCLYGALMSAVTERLAFVTLFLGGSAFLLVSQWTATLAKTGCEEDLDERSHPVPLITIAFCCAFVALSTAAATSGFALRMRAFYMPQALASTRQAKHSHSGSIRPRDTVHCSMADPEEREGDPVASSQHRYLLSQNDEAMDNSILRAIFVFQGSRRTAWI